MTTSMPKHKQKRLTPYQRIVRAAEKRKGVRLTAEDCFEMWKDTAIYELAANDDEADEAQELKEK